ncbi:MerR family transcriptional regulator [uncultured Desulfosarcina sp.]|uniref:MerR family transcriptional regulator n=1 Tax=uncultured Desulfosarcina sp. TaxID=218289 RepID=UPI0029C8D9D1|nr:MerR family transcriptional regulator [uncultured Desulfosarcina sp.]
MAREFSPKDLEEITGIAARRIKFYSDCRLLSLREQNPGRGRGRKYSRQNVFELLLIKTLDSLGVMLSRIEAIFASAGTSYSILLDLATYEKDDPPGLFVQISENGVQFAGVRDRGSLKGTETITLDMSGMASTIIINMISLARKVPG